MFIPHSTARTRLVRLLFLLLAVAPVAAIAGWAAIVRSTAHRHAVEGAWERALGVPVRLAGLSHARPAAVRVVSCRLATTDGTAWLEIPQAEVETTSSEVRVRIARIRCDPAGARLLASLAGDWLGRGSGWMQNCVVEVADFAWQATAESIDLSPPPALGPASLRIECVATAEGRAVRVVLCPGGEPPRSEVRVMRSPADFPDVGSGSPPRIDLVGSWIDPLPVAVLAGLASCAPPSIGNEAVATGQLNLWRERNGWHGTVSGRIAGIDLATCGDPLEVAAAGSAEIEVRSLELVAGRLEEGEIAFQAGRGLVARSFLDRLVTQLGCRPGMISAPVSPGASSGFDQAGALVRFHDGEFELLPAARLGGALAVGAGGALIWPPQGSLPASRLAWLLAPPGTPSLPAAGPGAWLMSLVSGGRDEGREGLPSPIATRPAPLGTTPHK